MPNWLTPFFTFSYWFTPYPAPFTGVYFWLMISLSGASFLLGLVGSFIYFKFKDPSNRKIIKKISNLAITFGVLMGISFFFTQTSTPTLGSRFWFLLWLIMAVVWISFILKYAIWQAPQERAERARKLANQKYFNK